MASLSLPLPFCGNRLVEADFSIRFAREPFFGRGKERERERDLLAAAAKVASPKTK
jgi:hypothetical protein